MPTALEMTPEEWRKFKPTKNPAIGVMQRKRTKEKRTKALGVARQAAALLRKQFNAKKIVIFGSLANEGAFSPWSDIDLAAWGISPDEFYLAVAAVTGLSPVFKIDLVEPNNCRKTVRDAIKKQGIEI